MGGNLSQEQREILSLIDTILSLGDNFNEEDINITVRLNPFQYLFKILEKIVTYDDIVDWLARMLTVILPGVELAIKGILLTKLKERIDCNGDPRIPNWMRKSDIFKDNGLLFNVHEIDINNMLRVSPLSQEGQRLYFGTKSYFIISDNPEVKDKKYALYDDAVDDCRYFGVKVKNIREKKEIDNVYQLARANDFNAFLWFVMHKANYIMVDKPFADFNILDNVLTKVDENGYFISPGSAFLEGKSLMALCINAKGDGKGDLSSSTLDNLSRYNGRETAEYPYNNNSYEYTIVPVSDDNKSANWYANSGTFHNYLRVGSEKEPRDYSKEFPICNLQYIEKQCGIDDKRGPYCFNEAIRFTILPKPFVHVPRNEEPAWRFRRLLFDCDGIATKKGKYTADISNASPEKVTYKDDKGKEKVKYYKYDINGNFNVKLFAESGDYYLYEGEKRIANKGDADKANLCNVLKECYKGLTVYEFNYDYVMSIQLFDSVTIANRLISSITNIRNGGVNLNLKNSVSETAYQMRISEIIKNILEAPAYEVSDCFFTFDNSKFDAMIRESELKRSQLYPFNKNGKVESDVNIKGNDALNLLSEFSDNATLNENIDVIKRSFTQATASVTAEVLPEERYKIEFNIIFDALQSLTNVLVETLLSPKIIMLFQVNIALLGKRDKSNAIKGINEILMDMIDVVVAVILELKDLILQEILSWVIKLLKELFNVLKDALIKEQLEYYSKLMKLLLKACAFKAKHRKPLDSKLDDVDYADIDNIYRPKEASC